MCEADHFLTCSCDVYLVTVRLMMLSCLLECHINIYLSDCMQHNCFLFLLSFIFDFCFDYICVCVCVCVCIYVGSPRSVGICDIKQVLYIM
jgi:hypothetical protein